ncbi:MAG: DUF4294 domain-containing protein [Bacteroidales bacterium]|nr:DUF4294 domain-containing protein [Bacteroidales bacterium]MCB9013145.1 DUF4294 domain-containing protein [Bacteroidales bacterium]
MILVFPLSLFSQLQQEKDTINVMRALVIGNDTVLVSSIPELNIYPRVFSSRWEHWKYRRLIRNVKVAYPYAKLAGKKLKDLDLRLASMRNERQKTQFINQTEKQLKAEFEDQLKNLTITQGRILIKLIYRETGNTTYGVLQDVKGNFSAGFWQAVARIFGSNLKSVYDPLNDEEDKNIEYIIQLIDMGML